MREVAIIRVGGTKFGELGHVPARPGHQAGLSAVYDANLSDTDRRSTWATCRPAVHRAGAHQGPHRRLLRVARTTSATRVEAAGASRTGVPQGVMAVASGMQDIVVVGGAEKMTDVGDVLSTGQAMAADQQWETSFGDLSGITP